MKKAIMIFVFLFLAGIVAVNVFSESSEFTNGNPEQGISHFNDPGLGGSSNTLACSSCHPDGKGLHGVAEKKEYTKTGDVDLALKKKINQCIVKALKGKALDPATSPVLQDMVAYLKTLK